jgi:hypothetical protein
MNRMVQPKVKVTLWPTVSLPVYLGVKSMLENPTLGGLHLDKIFNVTIGRAACEACSATWILDTNSAFVLGPRKTTENLDRVVARPSGSKLTSSQQSRIKYASPNNSPYLCCCFIEKHLLYKLFLQIFLCAYNLDEHQTAYNTCGRN